MNQPTDPISNRLKRCADCRVLNRSEASSCQACHGQNFEEMQFSAEFAAVTTPDKSFPQSNAVIQTADGPVSTEPSSATPTVAQSLAGEPNVGSTMQWLIVILFSLCATAIVAQPNQFMMQSENRIFFYIILILVASLLTSKGRIITFSSNMLAVVGTVFITTVAVSFAMFLAVMTRCTSQ